MTTPVKIEDGKMYGHRARIGYTSPPLTTEIFPYEFYKIVPDGVTLVVTSLAIVVRSKDEVDQSYDISMRAAREMAAAGCNIVVLGGTTGGTDVIAAALSASRMRCLATAPSG